MRKTMEAEKMHLGGDRQPLRGRPLRKEWNVNGMSCKISHELLEQAGLVSWHYADLAVHLS